MDVSDYLFENATPLYSEVITFTRFSEILTSDLEVTGIQTRPRCLAATPVVSVWNLHAASFLSYCITNLGSTPSTPPVGDDSSDTWLAFYDGEVKRLSDRMFGAKMLMHVHVCLKSTHHPCRLQRVGSEQSAAALWTCCDHQCGWDQTHSDAPRLTVGRGAQRRSVKLHSLNLAYKTCEQGINTMDVTICTE